MRYLFICIYILLFAACSSKEFDVEKKNLVCDDNASKELGVDICDDNKTEITDLVNIPQYVKYFTDKIDINESIDISQKRYEKYYFSMWNTKKPKESLESVKWPFYSYKSGNSYGENLQPLKKDFFDEMLNNSNFNAYATLNKKAITLSHLNIRAFPTIRPLLRDPSLAGEGFPFDYLQNSTVHANKPIFVSHYSKDKEWVYIFSSFASGWVKSNEIVFLEKRHTDKWQKAEQIVITKEGIPLYSVNGDFLFKSKIGTMFALVEESKEYYTVLVVSSYKNSKPLFVKSKISKDAANKGILGFKKDNLKQIMDDVSKTNYGWGGMYGQRDCSSTLRDMFAPFGIWLPRNSFQQSKIGKVIDLSSLTDDEKIGIIKEKAIPFQTLLYKRGHIVLYVGTINDEIIIFHNTWGIKTKEVEKEGRVVIGKTIFSTLKLGQNQKNYDKEAEILRNLRSMNIVTNRNNGVY